MVEDAEQGQEVIEEVLTEAGEPEFDPGPLAPSRGGRIIAILTALSVGGLAAIKIFEDSVRRLMSDIFEHAEADAQLLFLAFAMFIIIVAGTSFSLSAIRASGLRKKLEYALTLLDKQQQTITRQGKTTNALKERIAELEGLEKLKDLAAQVDKALQGDQRIWVRRSVADPPPMKPRDKRPTRFVSFMNLKGGVGKTFLAANTAAVIGLEGYRANRTLLIDLDFQGTLSEGTVTREQLGVLYQAELTARRFWTQETLSEADLDQLKIDMHGCPNVDVIPADNTLDQADYQAQVEHILTGKENRFQFRRLLHQDWLFLKYDLVVFDCPPRLTASSINALACSDHVVIPTRLEPHSARAVANTLSELKTLRQHNVIEADILGIIPNEVERRGGHMIAAHQNAYAELRFELSPSVSEFALFHEEACSGEIAAGELPKARDFDKVAATSPAVRHRLDRTVREFVRRLDKGDTHPITI